MTTRSRKEGIQINVDWSQIQNKPSEIGSVTFETLDANGDIGSGANQVPAGDHDHEIGDMVLIFNNAIV